jgi:hypothetical protein
MIDEEKFYSFSQHSSQSYKTFFFIIEEETEKARVFARTKFFGQSLIFANKTGAYHCGGPLR